MFSILGHYQQWKFAQLGSKFCQKNKPSKNSQILLKFCQSGDKFSQNLVTLILGQPWCRDVIKGKLATGSNDWQVKHFFYKKIEQEREQSLLLFATFERQKRSNFFEFKKLALDLKCVSLPSCLLAVTAKYAQSKRKQTNK